MVLRSSIVSLTALFAAASAQVSFAQQVSVDPAETASALAAQAESESSAAANEIIVSGIRLRVSALRSQIATILKRAEGQLARYQDPVCVSVSGLPQDRSGVVKDQIEALARTASLRVAEASCLPNLTVIVSPDAPQFLAQLKVRRPELFAQMTALQRRQLLKQDGPSWSWQSVEPKRADGGPVEFISELSGGSGPPQRLAKGAYQVPGASLSRLSLPVRHDITGAFVVIDQSAVVGLTLQQVADYAGMVALTGTDAGSLDGLLAPSIMGLFSCDRRTGCEPAATDFDRALLKARYSGTASLSDSRDINRIASSIVRQLSAPKPDTKGGTSQSEVDVTSERN